LSHKYEQLVALNFFKFTTLNRELKQEIFKSWKENVNILNK